MVYKLTIDVDLMKADPPALGMDTLQQWKGEGKVELIEADKPKERKGPTAYGWPGAPPKPANDSEWGRKRIRAKKMTESGNADFKSVAANVFPGKDPNKLSMKEINDIAHLIMHHASKNEIFVTGNLKDFIEQGRRERLKAQFGILAMTPEETVRMLEEMEGWESIQPPAAAGAKRAKRAR